MWWDAMASLSGAREGAHSPDGRRQPPCNREVSQCEDKTDTVRRGEEITAEGALLELDLKPDLPLDSSNRTCKPINFFCCLGWFALRFPTTCYRKYLISHLARDDEAEPGQ